MNVFFKKLHFEGLENIVSMLLQIKDYLPMSQKLRNFMYTLLCTSINESLEVATDVEGSWVDLNTPHSELGEVSQIEDFESEMITKKGEG